MAKRQKLNPDNWQAIRNIWEYSPDEPSYLIAEQQAAEKHDFNCPGKQAIQQYAAISEEWARMLNYTARGRNGPIPKTVTTRAESFLPAVLPHMGA